MAFDGILLSEDHVWEWFLEGTQLCIKYECYYRELYATRMLLRVIAKKEAQSIQSNKMWNSSQDLFTCSPIQQVLLDGVDADAPQRPIKTTQLERKNHYCEENVVEPFKAK